MGTLHLYADSAQNIVCTSFLALAEALARRTINDDAVYDYVFNGAPHGGHTVFREIHLCEWRTVLELTEQVRVKPMALPPSQSRVERTLDDHANHCLFVLRRRLRAMIAAFGDRIDTALSGGYDSRLLLALLNSEGVSPRLHVYGGGENPDVQIARTIAEVEGLTLERLNKAAVAPVQLDAYPRVVESNMLAFDGYPTDGLFDMGIDLASRRARCVNGELMLNGGGGEIFRNFFHLPDRELSLREFVSSFYCQFDPTVCSARFDERAYARAFEIKLASALGTTASRVPCSRMDALYANFRCRFWMGRNNSVNNRLGFAVTPFIDSVVVDAALAVPLRLRNAGRLEARMITLANSRLASYPSAYGHPFNRRASTRRQLADLATRHRPAFLRRLSYRLKHLRSVVAPLQLSAAYTGQVVGTQFEYMRQFFVLRRVWDIAQYNRICTLEYLFQRLNAVDG